MLDIIEFLVDRLRVWMHDGPMPKPALQSSDTELDRTIAVMSGTDPRTVRRVREGRPVRYKNALAIHQAICELGLQRILARPFTDPDAAKDLGR